MSGVYLIRNNITGTVYIGSSMNVYKRIREHRTGLRGGYHHNAHLQRAWTTYGEGSFTFEIVEARADSVAAEQEWMDAFPADMRYNILTEAGPGRRGVPLSEETRRRMSTTRKRRYADPIAREKLNSQLAQARLSRYGVRI